jgi:DUF4097 and DUF4098 domain-containing protein YvlB
MTARTDRKLALAVGAVLAAIFTVCSALQVATWTTGSIQHSTHETIPGPVEALTLDVRGADVRLIASATDSVTIDSHSSGTLKTPELQVRPQRASVTVTGGCPEITFGHCEADITVSVPANTTIKVKAGSGDISAEGLGGNVDLHSSSGDVVGTDLTGHSVQLTSNSGDIVADGVSGTYVVTRTHSGDVVTRLTRVPEAVEARSNSGDVAVFVPPGDTIYRVDADTDSGDKNVHVADVGAPQSTITARTNSGDVNVDYGN